MKEMKLIMENFKKNMSEMFKGRELTDDELEKMDPHPIVTGKHK